MFNIPLLLSPAPPSLIAWRAACNAGRAQSAVHASRRQQPAGPAAGDDSWSSTVERRKASFTYSPPTGAPQRISKPPATQPQQRSSSGTSKPLRRQQRQQNQPTMQPNPAADDLDALIAQTATGTPTGSGSSSSVSSSNTLMSAVELARPSMFYSVRAAAQPTRAAVATGVPVHTGRQQRYAAADKLHLTPEAAKDIAWRLRKAGPPKRGQPVIRVFRYGIDDLRLFKALDLAGLEGRVVVVDTMQFADAVLTTRNKRTGKAVNLAEARRAAQATGVPLFVLRAVSAQRVLEALGPMLGLEQQPQQQLHAAGMSESHRQGLDAEPQGSSSRSFGQKPRLLRWEEVEGDGSEELLQLLWGAAGSSNSNNGSSDTAFAVEPSARWLAWRAAQKQQHQQPGDDGSQAALNPVAALKGVPAAVLECLLSSDVEDAREAMLPANPTQRAGERYMLRKPLRHGSRLRQRRLQRELRLQQVPW